MDAGESDADLIRRLGGEGWLEPGDLDEIKGDCWRVLGLLSDLQPHTTSEIARAFPSKTEIKRRLRQLRSYGFIIDTWCERNGTRSPTYFYRLRGRRDPAPSYSEYIKSDAWQRLAERRRKHDGEACLNCGRRWDLQVHHLTYARIGRERLEDLATLCKVCHRAVHDFAVRGQRRPPKGDA